MLLSGDVLFQGSIGRTDFPMGNHQDLIDAITKKLWPLGDDTAFIPGHGPMSTFARERAQLESAIAEVRERTDWFDDVAIVPGRRTRDPEDVDLTWRLAEQELPLPLLASAMDGVMSPGTATIVESGRLLAGTTSPSRWQSRSPNRSCSIRRAAPHGPAPPRS